MKMQNVMKMLEVIGLILLAAIVSVIIIPAYVGIGRDYTKTIEVDASEKIEWAISNAVRDVQSRDFIVKHLSVEYCWIDKTFKVECSGIDRGNLLKK